MRLGDDWAGFEQAYLRHRLRGIDYGTFWLRSWVQIPPGPLLSFWLTTVLD
jgi:hypothetical protein